VSDGPRAGSGRALQTGPARRRAVSRRAPHRAARTKAPSHPCAQLASAVGIDGSVDRLVQHPARGMGGMFSAKPRGDLVGRPVHLQSAPHIGKQRRARREARRFGATPPIPRGSFRGRGTVRVTAAVAGDLARNRRRGTADQCPDRALTSPRQCHGKPPPARSPSDDGCFCAAVSGARRRFVR